MKTGDFRYGANVLRAKRSLRLNSALALSPLLVAFAALNSLTIFAQPKDYSKFSHSTPVEHANLMGRGNCNSCHRQTGLLTPAFPIHRDCTGCHLVQFTGAGNAAVNPICTVCHNAADLSAARSTLKNFSALSGFTAEFDHAQHLQGIQAALPKGGCVACHPAARGGVARTIPARLDAHRICYECHVQGKSASQFSSCGTCHQLGRYSSTPTTSRAFGLRFSHADHVRRQGVNCQSCHKIRAKGSPQRTQVSSTVAAEHFVTSGASTCKTCHNARTTFGDRDTHDCKRCHRRDDFQMPR